MADGAEVEDRVDFDDDNYEEMDDDVEEQLEDEGGDVDVQDEQDDVKSQNSGKESPEEDRSRSSNNAFESVEDKEKPSAPVDDEDKQKRADLLALPPHGSEVFIGALPRDITEEDLRDLCESVGDIVEVSFIPRTRLDYRINSKEDLVTMSYFLFLMSGDYPSSIDFNLFVIL